jgi:hypothetical protein
VSAWIIHRLDDLNHWTRPGKSRCWNLSLCLWDSELLAYEAGWMKRRTTWHEARQMAARMRGFRRE